MVEVFPEIAHFDFVQQVFVGGRDDPHVDGDILVASDPADPVFLQGPQYFGLCRKAHVADFVEEKRSSVGLFEFAFVLFVGRRERPLLVPEKFAFDQLRRNGGAVDFDERLSGPQALFVQPVGDQLLAGSVGSADQYPRIGRSYFFDQPFDGNHCARGTDQFRGAAVRTQYRSC